MKIEIVLLLFCVSFSHQTTDNKAKIETFEGYHEGFGPIDWVEFTEAIISNQDEKDNRPIFLLVHRSDSRLCNTRREELLNSSEFHEISKQFLMVTLMNLPKGLIDEGYTNGDPAHYPLKSIIIDPRGRIRSDIYSVPFLEAKFKYYYRNAEALVQSMKNALEIFKKEHEARIENYNEGFGPVDWVDLETALRLNQDKTDNRPIVLFAHKSTCEQCKKLRVKLFDSPEFHEQSKKYLMVQFPDGRTDEKYMPDGNYLPRIVLIDTRGKVRDDLINKKRVNETQKFLYEDAERVIQTMKIAFGQFQQEVYEEDGFGPIDWVDFDKALELNKDPNDNRPIFLFTHRHSCGYCKKLRPKLHDSKEFHEISKKFIMTEFKDRKDSKFEKYVPTDAKYVPRVVFVDPKGNLRPDLFNIEYEEHRTRYYYPDAEKLVFSMRRFLEIFQKEKDQEDSFGPIDWIDIDQALRLNQDSNDRRPIFIVVHRKNCQKSKELKEKLSSSPEFHEISKSFLMVNSPNGNADENFSPRIVIIDQKGKIRDDIFDGKLEAENVVDNLKRALEIFKSAKSKDEF